MVLRGQGREASALQRIVLRVAHDPLDLALVPRRAGLVGRITVP
jgi:hypothetical protein